ncbi:MAG: hypothetical protein VW257_03585, partial [Quisquiliibacterium sp.]
MAINFRCFFLGCRTGARLAKALASYALFLLALPALAQSSLPEVRVQAGGADPASERATVGVIGAEPIATTPQSVSLIRNATLRDLGAASLSSAIRSETSAGDAYNTLGYVETIQVRGFT